MSKNNKKITLVDAHGEPLENILETISAESISYRIFNINKDNAAFGNNLLNFIVQNTPLEKGVEKVKINIHNPEFMNFCLNYGASEIITLALEEENEKALAKFLEYIGLPNSENATDEEKEKIENQLENLNSQLLNILPMNLALSIINIQTDISNILTMQTEKAVTTYQANNIQERFDNIAEYLNPEQQAAGYYNLSLIHRMLINENANNFMEYAQINNAAENSCLYKVLDYSADCNRIDYCVNRLGYNKKDGGRIKAAYRRALTVADTPFAIYKINLALAKCYLNEYEPKIGFVRDLQNTEKLMRAELYYDEALQYAPEADRLSIMKSIARLQKMQGNMEQWTKTYTEMALNCLNGEERSFALIEIAHTVKDLSRPYLERALYETRHDESISSDKKKLIYTKIDSALRPIYKKEQNTKGIQKLDKLMGKSSAKTNDKTFNPLVYYKIRQKKASSKD